MGYHSPCVITVGHIVSVILPSCLLVSSLMGLDCAILLIVTEGLRFVHLAILLTITEGLRFVHLAYRH